MKKVITVDYKDLDDSETPVTDYCRKLISQGENGKNALHAYKNGILNMIVNNIGKAAKLTVEGTRFVSYRPSHKKNPV
jgi:hypothetical protein